MADLVLGADLGGTSTRVLLTDLQGRRRGHGTGGSGNVLTDVDTAGRSLSRALRAALDGREPDVVRMAVLGVAGGSILADSSVRARFDQVLTGHGLASDAHYVSDVEVAFAAGTHEPSGAVLVAGTGSVAGVVENRRVARTAGGRGWLLGDEGSGFWVGWEAARHTLRTLDSGRPLPGLPVTMVAELTGERPGPGPASLTDRQRWATQLVGAATRAPVRLADMAPVVTAAAERGDPVAVGIVDRAAQLLAETLVHAKPPDSGPVVLSGGLLVGAALVRSAVRLQLPPEVADRTCLAGPGEVGAAWLALHRLDPRLLTGSAREHLTGWSAGSAAPAVG